MKPCSRWRPPRQQTDHDQEPAVAGNTEAVILIQVEYRESSSSAWKTHAVNTLKLGGTGGGTLPTAAALFTGSRARRCRDRERARAPAHERPDQGPRLHGRQLRHSQRMPTPTTTETTKYDFTWGLIMTEKRS